MRRIRWIYLAVAVAGLAIYPFVAATGKDAIYLLSSASVLVALWWGVRTYQPADRSPWLLLMAGFGCFFLGDATSIVLDHTVGAAKPFPSLADVAYLLFYPLVYVAIGRFLSSTGHPDRAAWVDASIWTTGVAVVLWEPLFQPYIVADGVSALSSIAGMVYPLLDLGLLLMVLRMLAGRLSVYPAYLLLTAGLVSLVAVDLAFNVREAQNVYVTGEFTDAGWLLLNLMVGLAALHPSMIRLTQLRTRAAGPGGRRRLQALLVPALFAPALMLYQLLSGPPLGGISDGLFAAAATAALLALVVARGRGLLTLAEHRAELLSDRTDALEAALLARERATQDLRRQVDHDTLTGLASRDRFVDTLDSELAAWNAGGSRPSIAFLDLNDFKTVNDTLGHDAGDLVLVEVADRLRSALPADHLIARFGGDEFAVLIHGDPEVAAQQLLFMLRPPLLLHGHELRPEVSIGVTTAAGLTYSSGDMLREADVAMYTAKRRGGGWARYQSGMSAVLLEQLDLRSGLVRALAEGEIEPWFQPVVDLGSGRLLGFEALARWCRPGHPAVGPGEWLTRAEETGLVSAIDRAVLCAAVTQLAAWRGDSSCEDLELSVNLSGRTLQQPGIEDEVLEALRGANVPPDRLILEVTELVLIKDAQVGERLQRLRAAGVRIALDDFGTGWSSLSYLGRFPVDLIKLDRSFTAELGRSPAAEAIPAAIVHLARGLSIQAVAEGVETHDQLQRLSRLGFRVGQGYLFGRARRAVECQALIRSSRPEVGKAITLGAAG
ncbi:MAG: bifunctional diguanylate cyclase/phosphodiesterase [Actinomycetota bacterium]|nr:bifunctional diguanylate cyclase/phosphodiesterase [Actinomycetota bacterium]